MSRVGEPAMRRVALTVVAVLLTSLSVCAQPAKRYEIIKEGEPETSTREVPGTGRTEIVVTVRFRLKALRPDDDPDGRDEIVITENGQEVHRVAVAKVQGRSLTTVLAMDVSGSMGRTSQS